MGLHEEGYPSTPYQSCHTLERPCSSRRHFQEMMDFKLTPYSSFKISYRVKNGWNGEHGGFP